jgi:hypothetical protein
MRRPQTWRGWPVQSLRTADGQSGFWIAVAPRWTSAGIEEDADNGQIEFSSGAGCAIGPVGPVGNSSPAIVSIADEVPPARMKRHVERRIGLARRFLNQIDCAVHAIEVDAEIRQLAFQADREHAVGALADRLRT